MTGCSLLLHVTDEIIPCPGFAERFQNINFFNDPLPAYGYKSLTTIINKYEMLNPTKALTLLKQWKAVLEEIQVGLGALQARIMSSSTKIETLKKLCKFNQRHLQNQSRNGDIYSRDLVLRKKVQEHPLQFCLQFPEHENVVEGMIVMMDYLYK
jgi:hypothetical protein